MMGIQMQTSKDILDEITNFCNLFKNNRKNLDILSIYMSTVVFHIWKERNNRIHNNKESSMDIIWLQIQNDVQIMINKAHKKDYYSPCRKARDSVSLDSDLFPLSADLSCMAAPQKPRQAKDDIKGAHAVKDSGFRSFSNKDKFFSLPKARNISTTPQIPDLRVESSEKHNLNTSKASRSFELTALRWSRNNDLSYWERGESSLRRKDPS